MKLHLIFIALISLGAGIAAGQTPTPTPEFRTYSEAMAAGNKAKETTSWNKAEAAYRRAVALSSNDTEKIEAMLGHAAALRRAPSLSEVYTSKSKYSKTRPYRAEDAYLIYQELLKMSTFPAARADEVRFLIADAAATCHTEYNGCLSSFETRIKNESRYDAVVFARAEYAKVIGSATAAPDLKARALLGRAALYDTNILFGSAKREEFTGAFQDLKAAAEMQGASDENKATAYFDIVALATKINDANTVAGAYERVTQLPAATNEQKIKAYKGLVLLLLGNNMIKASRDQLTAANKLAGLTRDQKITLLQLSAFAAIIDVDRSDPSALAKQKKTAISDLDKTTAFSGMTDDEKFKTYLANGEFYQHNSAAYVLSIDQYEKAMKLKTIDEQNKARAQYGIGETYRIQKKYAEAKEAYRNVSAANRLYHDYAAQRMKQVDAESGAVKP